VVWGPESSWIYGKGSFHAVRGTTTRSILPTPTEIKGEQWNPIKGSTWSLEKKEKHQFPEVDCEKRKKERGKNKEIRGTGVRIPTPTLLGFEKPQKSQSLRCWGGGKRPFHRAGLNHKKGKKKEKLSGA